jgi:methyl-accepting chemotaxis protein
MEQNSGAGQINSAIQQLNTVTQRNAASEEELATSAEELSAQADQLKLAMSWFKVNGEKISMLKKPLLKEKESFRDETKTKKESKRGVEIELARGNYSDSDFESF